MRKILFLIITGVVVAAIVATVMAARHNDPQGSAAVSPARSPASEKPKSDPSEAAAVFAANAVNDLVQARLQPKLKRWHTVRHWADASKRNLLYRQITTATTPRRRYTPNWKTWGYQTRLLAYLQAGYSVESTMYHVDRFSRKRARISLFAIYSWKDLNTGERESDCAIVIEKLKKHNSRWWYLGEETPPPWRRPDLSGSVDPRTHQSLITFKEKLSLFKPYLKNFQKFPTASS
jgi:hypothetical protein